MRACIEWGWIAFLLLLLGVGCLVLVFALYRKGEGAWVYWIIYIIGVCWALLFWHTFTLHCIGRI